MKKSTILILLCIGALIITPVNATILEDIWNKINPPHQNVVKIMNQPITQNTEDFNSFMERLHTLNTPTNIQLLNQEMADYNVNSIKIRMYKMPWDDCEYCGLSFYIVKDKGIVDFDDSWGYNNKDKEIALTYSQINRIYPYIESGRLDFFDRWQIYAIYKIGR